MYHEKNVGEECIFHDNVSVLSRKPLSLQRDLNIYTIQSEERRETGEQMPPSPPIMDRETILPEMTDMREPALAYTAVGESRPVAHPPRRTEDVVRAGKRRRRRRINANNGPHDKPN